MPRGRMLSRSISTSVSIEAMSEWAQLLFDRFVIWADDYGRLEGDPRVIKATTKPLSGRTPVEFAEATAEMITVGAVAAYAVAGRAYLHVARHEEHQRVDKRARSRYPAPEDGTPLAAHQYLSGIFPASPGKPALREEKGREVEENPPVVPLTGDTPPDKKPEERKGARDESTKRKPEKFEIEANFQPSPEDRKWARDDQGMNEAEILDQTLRFISHHRAKGNRFKRPDLAWRNWISGRFINGTRNRSDRRTTQTPTSRGATDREAALRSKFPTRTLADVLAGAK